MRLREGQLAPDFDVTDIYGRRVALERYRGRLTLLSFHRAAVCPLCNLRLAHLIRRAPAYRRAGLEIIAFFESSPARPPLSRPPARAIPDHRRPGARGLHPLRSGDIAAGRGLGAPDPLGWLP
jgi:hypothetical protein